MPAAVEFERQLLSDVRRYTSALQRVASVVVYSLLVVVVTAIITRLLACAILARRRRRSRDRDVIAESRDDDDCRPATVSVNAQARSFTVSTELRFSETKV